MIVTGTRKSVKDMGADLAYAVQRWCPARGDIVGVIMRGVAYSIWQQAIKSCCCNTLCRRPGSSRKVRRNDPSQVKVNWQPVRRPEPWYTTLQTVFGKALCRTRFRMTCATAALPASGSLPASYPIASARQSSEDRRSSFAAGPNGCGERGAATDPAGTFGSARTPTPASTLLPACVSAGIAIVFAGLIAAIEMVSNKTVAQPLGQRSAPDGVGMLPSIYAIGEVCIIFITRSALSRSCHVLGF